MSDKTFAPEIIQAALDYVMPHSDLDDGTTLRTYFKALLATLWREDEGFSGKRPFGNSGWTYDIYGALVSGGFVEGVLDEDGCPEAFDDLVADALVLQMIDDL